MAGEEVEAGVGRAADRAEIGVGGHGLQEAAGGIGVEACLAARPDADRVGLELLVARELRQPQLAADQRHVGARVLPEYVGHHLGGEHFFGFLLLALQAMVRRDVAHLVGDHGGEFGRIIGERKQPPRDIEIAARQREGIHVGRVQNGDAVGLAGIAGHGRQIADDLGHHALEFRVGIFAAVGRQDARVLRPRKLGQLVVARNRIDGDRSFGGAERRFLDLAAGRQARERLASGEQSRQPRRRGKARGAAQLMGRPRTGPSSADTCGTAAQRPFVDGSRRLGRSAQSNPLILVANTTKWPPMCGLIINYVCFRANSVMLVPI